MGPGHGRVLFRVACGEGVGAGEEEGRAAGAAMVHVRGAFERALRVHGAHERGRRQAARRQASSDPPAHNAAPFLYCATVLVGLVTVTSESPPLYGTTESGSSGAGGFSLVVPDSTWDPGYSQDQGTQGTVKTKLYTTTEKAL